MLTLFSLSYFVAFVLITRGVYTLSVQHRRTDSQACTERSVSKFNLLARYKNESSTSLPLKIIWADDTVPKVGYSILSASPRRTAWDYNVLKDQSILPMSVTNPHLNTVSYTLIEGDSPTFISTHFTPRPLSAYCFTNNLLDALGPPILAAHGDAESWSLCHNVTARGRLDVVWSAIANHPHYSLDSCVAVYLEQVS